jgi:dolichyl-diphosphooligosaccharide--protein glycosyltransferase
MAISIRQYLNDVCYLAPVGMGLILLAFCNDSSSFLVVYGIAAYFFSHRMVRLILLTAPIASALGGIALGHAMSWMVGSIFPQTPNAAAMWAAMMGNETDIDIRSPPKQETTKKSSSAKKDKKKGGVKAGKDDSSEEVVTSKGIPKNTRDPYAISAVRAAISAYILMQFIPMLPQFYEVCDTMAQHISHPTIIQKARTKTGQEVMIDDYRDAYFWLRGKEFHDFRFITVYCFLELTHLL